MRARKPGLKCNQGQELPELGQFTTPSSGKVPDDLRDGEAGATGHACLTEINYLQARYLTLRGGHTEVEEPTCHSLHCDF